MTRHTLYNWMDRGIVEWVYLAGGHRRIVTATLWREPLKHADVDTAV